MTASHHVSTHNLIMTHIITVKSETGDTLGDQFHDQYYTLPIHM